MKQVQSRLLLALLSLALTGCADEKPSWVDRNQQVIDEHKVTGRTRELPALTVPTVLTDGEPVERTTLPVITLAPGVTATLGWGRGALAAASDLASACLRGAFLPGSLRFFLGVNCFANASPETLVYSGS